MNKITGVIPVKALHSTSLRRIVKRLSDENNTSLTGENLNRTWYLSRLNLKKKKEREKKAEA